MAAASHRLMAHCSWCYWNRLQVQQSSPHGSWYGVRCCQSSAHGGTGLFCQLYQSSAHGSGSWCGRSSIGLQIYCAADMLLEPLAGATVIPSLLMVWCALLIWYWLMVVLAYSVSFASHRLYWLRLMVWCVLLPVIPSWLMVLLEPLGGAKVHR